MDEIVKRRDDAIAIIEEQYTIEINNGVELVVAAQNYYRRVAQINKQYQHDCDYYNLAQLFQRL